MLANDIHVVDVLGGIKFKKRIIVNVIVESLRAHTEARDDFAAIERLFRTGDCPALDQIDDPVAEHLGVNAEVLFIFEEFRQGLRDASDAAFDGTAVLDEPGDVLSDPA